MYGSEGAWGWQQPPDAALKIGTFILDIVNIQAF